MSGDRDRLVVAAFGGSAVLAGANAVGVRFSNRELDPLWGAGLRFGLAAIVMGAILAVLRLELPRGRALGGAALFGLLNFAGSFALFYYALTELHAGFGQVILSVAPLATLLLAVAEGQEPMRWSGILGSVISLAGVAVMSSAPLDADVSFLAIAAALGSALCFAQAAVLVRWLPPMHPVTMNAIGMAAGAVALILGSLAVSESIELPVRAATWGAVTYLVVLGSVVVFLLYLYVLGRWSASRTAYGFVLIPFVTVALSAWLDDEPIGAGLVAGGALVIAGVYVGALRGEAAARTS